MMNTMETVTMLTKENSKMILSTNRMGSSGIGTNIITNSIIITFTTTNKTDIRSTKKKKLKKMMMERKVKSVMNTKVKLKWMTMKKKMISKKMSTLRRSTNIP